MSGLNQRGTYKRHAQMNIKIRSLIEEGTSSKVFRIEDNFQPQKHLIMKQILDANLLQKEKEILKLVGLKQWSQFFPSVEFNFINSMILGRLGNTLEHYYNEFNFSFQQINLIGLQLLEILQKLHSLGYNYNNLSGTNISVGHYKEINPN